MKYWMFTLCALTHLAMAADRTARMYEVGMSSGTPIYTQKMHYETLPSGETASTVTVFDSKGVAIVTEKAVYRGSKLISQNYDQTQTKKRMEVKVDDGWIYFKTSPLDGDKKIAVKEDHEKMPSNFMTGPVSEAFLMEHLTELMAGETVFVHFGVLELRETIGFKFWKIGMTKVNDKEVVELGMKPSNIFLGFLVDPIHIYIDAKAKKLVKFTGRTPLWKTVNGSLKPVDADIFYD